jgi:hypothetical protein
MIKLFVMYKKSVFKPRFEGGNIKLIKQILAENSPPALTSNLDGMATTAKSFTIGKQSRFTAKD